MYNKIKFANVKLISVASMIFFIVWLLVFIPNHIRIEILFDNTESMVDVIFQNMDSSGNILNQGIMEDFFEKYKFKTLDLEQALGKNGSQYKFDFFADKNLNALSEGTTIDISNIKVSLGHWELYSYSAQNILDNEFITYDLEMIVDDNIKLVTTGSRPRLELLFVRRTILSNLIRYVAGLAVGGVVLFCILVKKNKEILKKLQIMQKIASQKLHGLFNEGGVIPRLYVVESY